MMIQTNSMHMLDISQILCCNKTFCFKIYDPHQQHTLVSQIEGGYGVSVHNCLFFYGELFLLLFNINPVKFNRRGEDANKSRGMGTFP